MRYDRIITGYHGCDAEVAIRLLDGEPFKPSENDYDWLGRGIYFWEYGADRAYRFAEKQVTWGRVKTPAVVGALRNLETGKVGAPHRWTLASLLRVEGAPYEVPRARRMVAGVDGCARCGMERREHSAGH